MFPGLRLEPSNQGDRPEAAGSHRRRFVHRLPPDREHHRLSLPRERQDHQIVEEQHLDVAPPAWPPNKLARLHATYKRAFVVKRCTSLSYL